ncbi:hypothetical protein GIB67_001960 [Kingdonia uniflora]|uniref:TF-B3 domain-containing protein n=1 Tax=Kingdonia uniflora TaxID=39325 RepID=A0A7J7NT59_9MAGN|nr:hypothetical protein GIB67_001960 [Kingdonia uniflora]
MLEGSWKCEKCHNMNYPFSTKCNRQNCGVTSRWYEIQFVHPNEMVAYCYIFILVAILELDMLMQITSLFNFLLLVKEHGYADLDDINAYDGGDDDIKRLNQFNALVSEDLVVEEASVRGFGSDSEVMFEMFEPDKDSEENLNNNVFTPVKKMRKEKTVMLPSCLFGYARAYVGCEFSAYGVMIHGGFTYLKVNFYRKYEGPTEFLKVKISTENILESIPENTQRKMQLEAVRLAIVAVNWEDMALEIPVEFIPKFGGTVPKNVRLKSVLGEYWSMEIGKSENRFFFGKGWEGFVKDNSLKLGEFIVFRYKGKSLLNFKIFGHNGLEKEVWKRKKTTCFINVENEKEVARSRENSRKPTHSLKPKYSGKIVKKVTRTEKDGRPLLVPKEEEVQDSPCLEVHEVSEMMQTEPVVATKTSGNMRSASAFKSKNPYLAIVMGHAYLNNRYLYISTLFVRENFPEVVESVRLEASDGRTWNVEVYKKAPHGMRLTHGWHEFVSDNRLKMGNVCVFELIEKIRGVVFKVHVFPAEVV